MISHVKGILTELEDGIAVVETGGVGFSAFVPQGSSTYLPVIGEEIMLYTYLSYSQEGFTLFGFYTKEEKSIFTMLITVSGIGPKGAIGILSHLSVDDIRYAIASGDADLISSVPGIGKKTAQKVIIELHDKVEARYALMKDSDSASDMKSVEEGTVGEAIDALCALGYKRNEAHSAVMKHSDITDVEELLKAALREL